MKTRFQTVSPEEFKKIVECCGAPRNEKTYGVVTAKYDDPKTHETVAVATYRPVGGVQYQVSR